MSAKITPWIVIHSSHEVLEGDNYCHLCYCSAPTLLKLPCVKIKQQEKLETNIVVDWPSAAKIFWGGVVGAVLIYFCFTGMFFSYYWWTQGFVCVGN
jgi:hypothetical protein